jgi:hypothetical protein
MLERELQACIIDAARIGGWRVAHFRTALNGRGHYMTPVAADGKGWPDLVLVRDRVIFAELKSAKGTVSVDQAEWMRVLRAAGEDVRVVRPDDLEAFVAELLARPKRARRAPAQEVKA